MRAIRIAVLLMLALTAATVGLATAAEPAPSVRLPWKEAGWTEREAAAHLLDRFAHGARPGEVDRVMAMGLDHWVERQLAGGFPEPATLDPAARPGAGARHERRGDPRDLSADRPCPRRGPRRRRHPRGARPRRHERRPAPGGPPGGPPLRPRAGLSAAARAPGPAHGAEARPRRGLREPARRGDDRLLVQPFQRLADRQPEPPASPRLRARRHPAARPRPLPRSPGGHGQASGHASLPRQRAVERRPPRARRRWIARWSGGPGAAPAASTRTTPASCWSSTPWEWTAATPSRTWSRWRAPSPAGRVLPAGPVRERAERRLARARRRAASASCVEGELPLPRRPARRRREDRARHAPAGRPRHRGRRGGARPRWPATRDRPAPGAASSRSGSSSDDPPQALVDRLRGLFETSGGDARGRAPRARRVAGVLEPRGPWAPRSSPRSSSRPRPCAAWAPRSATRARPCAGSRAWASRSTPTRRRPATRTAPRPG